MFIFNKNIIWGILLVIHSSAQLASATSQPTVFILNSDRSVEKYWSVESSFKSTYSGEIKSLNLKKVNIEEDGAANLLNLRHEDLIYCIGSKALIFAVENFPNNRILLSSAVNGEHLKHNSEIYRIAEQVPLETQLTNIKMVFSFAKKIGIIYSPELNEEWVKDAVKEARAYGIEIKGRPYDKSESVDNIFSELLSVVDAILLIPDPGVITKSSFGKMIKISNAMKKPIITYSPNFVEKGAVLSISIDDKTVGNQAAVLAKRIINKEKIGSNRQYPAGSYTALNLKKIKEFDLRLNQNFYLASISIF